jgi:tRNA(Ile2) C34 agmatinyltransferase TiaS
MPATRCPGCPTGMKAQGKYLCLGCWNTLTMTARRALNRRDSQAFARLRELHRQLDTSVPLAEIRITA